MVDYFCPVCGYDKFDTKPYDDKERGSFEICDCCGFQFGVDDVDKGYTLYDYRKEWIQKGASWFVKESRPQNWDQNKQLMNIEVKNVISEC